jgi:hypothetical protein
MRWFLDGLIFDREFVMKINGWSVTKTNKKGIGVKWLEVQENDQENDYEFCFTFTDEGIRLNIYNDSGQLGPIVSFAFPLYKII